MQKAFLVSIYIIGICFANKLFAQNATPEMQVVQKFMEYSLLPEGMKSIPDSTKEKRKALISPAYLKSKNYEHEKYMVNMFVPVGFKVDQNDGAEVRVYIWGLFGSWKHELFFKVEKEGSDYFVIPLKESEVSKFNLFDPWINVIRNSKFDKEIIKQK